MSLPTFDFPPAPVIAGDHSDDDAEQIDNLVEQEAEPPTPGEMPKESGRRVYPKPPEVNRLIAGTTVLRKEWTAPVMILPSDPYRKTLLIQRNIESSAAVVQIAGTPDETGADYSGSFLMRSTEATLSLNGYTGAVYARCFPGSTDAQVEISYAAVTK